MKAVAISVGRKNGNCEILLKEALMGIEETCGAQVELIRLLELTIKPCTGCESCMKGMLSGGSGECVQKGDHIPFFLDTVAGADGVILGVPAYELMPPGILHVLANRMLGSGRKFREAAMQRPKVKGLIALGGTDWTNLVVPLGAMTLNMIGMGTLVDQFLVQYVPSPGQVVLRDDALARARTLGRKVGESMKLSPDKVEYRGDIEEACPLCHQNLLEFRGKAVVCPFCDIEGTITFDADGKPKVVYTDEWAGKRRFSPWGHQRHNEAVARGHKENADRIEEIKSKRKKYNDYKVAKAVPPLSAK